MDVLTKSHDELILILFNGNSQRLKQTSTLLPLSFSTFWNTSKGPYDICVL